MNTQLAGQHWFVLLNGKRHGPFPFAALTKAAKQGVITAETNVWRRGWQKWHPARQVPGLLNEAPLAPDDAEWTDERLGAPTEEALLYAPRRVGARPAPDVVTLRGGPPPSENPTEHIFADEWRMLAEQPAQDRGKVGSRFGRKKTAKSADLDVTARDLAVYRPAARADNEAPAEGRRSYKRAVVGLLAILLLCVAGWFRLGAGLSRQSTDTKSMKASYTPASSAVTAAAPDNLPVAVASLPAVVALQHNDPSAFERFKTRYADSAQNAPDDQVQSLARSALRKSVKHLLAISSGDVLLEITETSLAYMQGLQASNPESCVALSDESKGAKLTSNLAKELPVEFARDMSVLERIAGTNPHTAVAPMAAEEARPFLETVFNTMRTQSVKSELLGSPKLEHADFAPYCSLVIAFYKAVLDLPRDDKVNLLRYLYAAAANADSDHAK
jgi:hypothetical protein